MFLFMTVGTPLPRESAEDRITRLMTSYGDDVLRVCYLFLKEHSIAQDASQTTFVKAWQAISTLRDGGTERAWLMRIAVNTCKTILRSREHRLYAQSPVLDDLPLSTEDELPDDTVLHAVLDLPEKYREVVVLYYYQGLSSTETAKALRIPQTTVLTRLHRARKLLESKLKGWYMSNE